MKKIIYLFLVISLFACSNDDVDDVKPVIDLSFAEAFPLSCDTLYFGEVFTLRMKFTDNEALSAYSINIHDNFNHHAHDTEVNVCEFDDYKVGVNPLVLTNDYDIPEGQTEYITELTFQVPQANNAGDYEAGDYHFFINLVDAQGWSAQKGLSIKILHR